MIKRNLTLYWVGALLPGLCILCFCFFTSGCGEKASTQSLAREEGPKFFTRQNPVQVNIPALNKLAKEESLVLIDSGEFFMGSPEDEVGRSPNETRNRVRITQPFWIKKFEVTREEWNAFVPQNQKKGRPIFHLTKKILEALCGSSGYQSGNFTISEFQDRDGEAIYLEEAINRANLGFWTRAKKPRNYKVNSQKFKDMNKLRAFLNSHNIKQIDRIDQLFPVSRVSYSQVVAYCWEKTQRGRLNKSLPSPFVYRLPTEAEWEYACRAGTSGVCGLGEGDFLSGENANIDGSIRGYIIDNRPKSEFSEGGSFVPIFRKGYVPIRKNSPAYPPNAWGLYDMHGNVLEWCYDFYDIYPEGNLTRVDPIGPIRGIHRIVRGGSFVRSAHESRSAKRLNYEPSYRGSEIGFRYVLGLPLR